MKFLFFTLVLIFSLNSYSKSYNDILSFEKECIQYVKAQNRSVNCSKVSKKQFDYFLTVQKVHKENPFCKTLAMSNFSSKKVAWAEYNVSKCLP